MDYYKVLGCNKNSTHEEIKRAYHRCLLQFHPDKNSTTDVREFHNIKKAWKVLGLSQSRNRYDAVCKQKELEDEDGPVYARLSPSDLEESIVEDALFYRCRCGDRYFIERQNLPEENNILQVTCDGCTLTIIIET